MLHKTKKSNTAFACLLSATLMSCALRPTSPIVSAIPTPDGPELTSPEPRITAIEKPPQPKLEVEPESQHAFHINASQSKVTYRAREKWIKEDVLDIVLGGTQQISGVIWLKPAQPRNAQLGPMTVNLYSMRSDDQERDEKVRHRRAQIARGPTDLAHLFVAVLPGAALACPARLSRRRF